MVEDNLAVKTFDKKTLHLSVAVWGADFCDKFLSYAVRSLLAPGNIPTLSKAGGSKVVIATTTTDQEYLRKSSIFERLSKAITVDFIDLPTPVSDRNKYALMSEGHKLIADYATSEEALAVIMCPDTFFSSNFIQYLDEESRDGLKVLMVTGIRFSEEPILREFERQNLLDPDTTLNLSAREIAGICLPHLHPETRRSDWDNPCFSHYPLVTHWQVGEGDGIIVHTLSWGPLAVDYGAISDHDSDALNRWTIDGDYVFRNFAKDDPGIRYQSDSDNFAYVSLTPEQDQHEDPVKNWTKGASLRCSYHHENTDELKQKLFWNPVLFHAVDLNPEWEKKETEIQELLSNVIRKPTRFEEFWTHYYRGGIPGVCVHIRDWVRARTA